MKKSNKTLKIVIMFIILFAIILLFNNTTYGTYSFMELRNGGQTGDNNDEDAEKFITDNFRNDKKLGNTFSISRNRQSKRWKLWIRGQ